MYINEHNFSKNKFLFFNQLITHICILTLKHGDCMPNLPIESRIVIEKDN